MAAGEKKVSLMTHITSAPDSAKFYIVLADGSYGYITKAELLAGISGGSIALGDITDVALDGPSNGQVLTYNSTTNKWENQTFSGGTPTLQEVVENGREFTETVGDWTNTFNVFKSELGEDLFKVKRQNNVTGEIKSIDIGGEQVAIQQGLGFKTGFLVIEQDGVIKFINDDNEIGSTVYFEIPHRTLESPIYIYAPVNKPYKVEGYVLATTDDIPSSDTFVPYTGATSYLDIGNNNIYARGYKLHSVDFDLNLGLNSELTATRTVEFKDEDGVVALLSDIPSSSNFVPYTGATADLDLGEYELKSGQLTLDTTPTGTASVATTRWNDAIGSSETTLKGGSVILKNGVDLVARVVNKVTPNTTLTKANYQVVKVSGAQGQRLAVNLAQANNDNNSADTLGIVCETIATNQEGFIITVGQLEGINTTGSLQSETWADGDVLYLSPTTAGRITNIKPTGATGHIVILGYVEYAHSVNGKIYVKIMNGWELDELHNVYISSIADKQLLSYDSATSLWKNKSVTTADIASSTNKNYVTDAQATVIGNTSGINTGDQDLSNLVIKNTAITGATKTKITYDAKGLVTSGADLIASDIPTIAQSQVTNLVTDLAGKQDTLGYTPYRFIQTSQTAHTGTTAETILATATIAGGTFNASDIIKVLYGLNKSLGSSALTMRLRINTSNTLTGATQIATFQPTASANVNLLTRTFSLNGGNLYGLNFGTQASSDIGTIGQILTSATYNTANTLYLFFTIQLGNSADSATPNLCNINN